MFFKQKIYGNVWLPYVVGDDDDENEINDARQP